MIYVQSVCTSNNDKSNKMGVTDSDVRGEANEPVPTVPEPKIEINMSDPKVLRMYTKAMKVVKQSYDGDWNALSSDERKALINVELVKML